ncbi:Trm112 family protein [Jiulongibacter sp. NS-SX5]|uniref:Trm112 family protein n=1 Tax=Jiulongibacter sp. NS-SX5 TaxID=3463854 RepID=UPI0040590FF0
MQKDFIHKLCCSFDKAELSLEIYTEKENGDIHEGMLTCSSCQKLFPIVHGVPLMIPDDYRQPELEKPFFIKWEHKLSEPQKKMLAAG